MMMVPGGVNVHLALGYTDMRKGLDGLCLFTKRLDQGRLVWPTMVGIDGSITLTPAQLAMLIEGIDWRAPERVWRPALAG